ncbi:MAG: DUF3137 domain-containing protein [Candidatus Omnitrophica bacterium]|nr:DUF3137 domain-containing protein [Candidatus Omnitrophota bacterium]
MKTLSEIRELYHSVLLPELEVLEGQRKLALNNIIIVASIVFPLALLLAYFIKDFWPMLVGFFIVAGAVAFISKDYVRNFKTGIIEKIVHAVDEKLNYSQAAFIPRSLFSASEIFRHKIDRYRGDDHVQGMLGRTKVEFSEVHAEYETRDSKGRTQHHTIFRGLFFVADFNKHFKGTTIVLPDTAERLFGGLGAMFQSWNKTRGALVKLEDPEFEKLFVVYGEDQIEARYILSTSLMKRISDFRKKTNKNIFLSFKGSKIFIAIPYYRGLFEPRIFRTIIDFAPIEQYFEDLQLATGIVDDLNLNIRIWSKQ